MTTLDRQLFWDTLCSLGGEDITADQNKLKSTISYPQYIYRYRPVNLKTIDALQQNKLYFSNANYYDDPFDTLIHINFNTVNAAAKQFFDDQNLEEKLQQLSQYFGIDQQAAENAKDILKTHTVSELINGIDNYLKKHSIITERFVMDHLFLRKRNE